MSKYTKELLSKLSALFEDNQEEDPAGEFNEEGIRYLLVSDSGWDDQGRYSYNECVFNFPDFGVMLCISNTRSGSYFTDYEYNDSDFYFVEEQERTVVIKEYLPVRAI